MPHLTRHSPVRAGGTTVLSTIVRRSMKRQRQRLQERAVPQQMHSQHALKCVRNSMRSSDRRDAQASTGSNTIAEGHRRSRRRMRRLQAVVPHRACRRQSDVNDRRRALEFVMAVVVKQIRNPDRRAGPRRFDHRERRVIIDDIVGEQNFLPPAPPHVQRRKIIECARRANAREQQIVRRVPKAMLVRTKLASRRGRLGSDDWSRSSIGAGVIRGGGLRSRRRLTRFAIHPRCGEIQNLPARKLRRRAAATKRSRPGRASSRQQSNAAAIAKAIRMYWVSAIVVWMSICPLAFCLIPGPACTLARARPPGPRRTPHRPRRASFARPSRRPNCLPRLRALS